MMRLLFSGCPNLNAAHGLMFHLARRLTRLSRARKPRRNNFPRIACLHEKPIAPLSGPRDCVSLEFSHLPVEMRASLPELSSMTKDTPRLNAFPVFMRVEGEAVVIVGDGDEALAKARLLSQSSARLRIVAADAGACPRRMDRRERRRACRRRLSSPPIWTARCWSSPPPATRRSTAAISEDARAAGIPGQRRRPSRTLRLLHAGAGQPRAARRRHRHRRRRPGAGADRARQDRPAAVAVAGPLAALANSFREAAERLAAEGRPRAAASGTISSPARRPAPWRPATQAERSQRGLRTAVAQRTGARPYRAGRRRSGRGGSADAARASAADGSRRRSSMTRWCRRPSSPWAAATPSACRSASARAATPRARPRSTRCWSRSAARASASCG